MNEQLILFSGIVFLLHVLVFILSVSIRKRRFMLFGGAPFVDKEAPYICTLHLVLSLVILYAALMLSKAIVVSISEYDVNLAELRGRLVFLFSAAMLVSVVIAVVGYIFELRRRYAELGKRGVTLRVLSSFAISAVVGYVSYHLGFDTAMQPVKVASIAGFSFAIQMQMG